MSVSFAKNSNSIVVNDFDRKIKITEEIVNLFKKYRQVEKELEAGGILIGREEKDNNNLIIEYATCPMKKDLRKKYSFYRKDKEHIKYFNRIYEENNGIYAYIGEWHTHPEKIPSPSIIDKKNWKRIWKERKDSNLYNVIVGTEKIGIWKCNQKIERIY